jgi:hypothetical protein
MTFLTREKVSLSVCRACARLVTTRVSIAPQAGIHIDIAIKRMRDQADTDGSAVGSGEGDV